MSLRPHPIVSALLRSRMGAVLVAIQIAIALMVLVNAIAVVDQRLTRMHRPTGLDEANLLWIGSHGFTPRFDAEATMRTDLDYLRRVDGVALVTPTNVAPLGWDFTGNIAWTNPDKKGPPRFFALVMSDEHALDTWGTHLIAGRGFRADEILPPLGPLNSGGGSNRVLIVSNALAHQFFPDGHAVGKRVFYGDGKPVTIIGVTEDVLGPQGIASVGWVPQLPGTFGGSGYLVRTIPGARDRVIREVEAHLPSNPDRVIVAIRSIESYKSLLYLSDRNLTLFLVFVTVLMVGVTCLGIFGLATYNVSTRTKQIGTRRAVGARRMDILRQFMIENWLITSVGVVGGCILALAANDWLVREYSADFLNLPPRVDLYYLIGAALGLYVVGQLAAWHPARKAAAVSPAVATRTV
jgi:putative ABC transport system permease protein